MQKVMLIGNLGRDPEVKYSQQGTAIAQFSVATTERWKDKAGELQEHTEWFAVKTSAGGQRSSARVCTKDPASISKAASVRSRGTTSRRAASITGTSFMPTRLSSWIPGAEGTTKGTPAKVLPKRQR